MIPENFINFFLASAGAGGALVGLLFVAISVAPERILATGAPVEYQVIAVNAFTSVLNAFIISLVALIPKTNLGVVTLIMSVISVYTSLSVGWYFLKERSNWLIIVQRLALVLLSLVVYGFEIIYASTLLIHPDTVDAVYTIAQLLVAAYAVGLTRAWQLLGGQRYGLMQWLNPLHKPISKTAKPEPATPSDAQEVEAKVSNELNQS